MILMRRAEEGSDTVSVIVPVYNVEKYLAKCLDSILAQEHRSIEIICVNDCSTDTSPQILNEYSKAHQNIIVIDHEVNQGLGAARDTGLRAATGRFVMFVDSDDHIRSDHVSTYLSAMDEDADIVQGGYYREEGKRVSEIRPRLDSHYGWISVSACLKMFRLRFLRENNITFEGRRAYEDVPFTYLCMLANPQIKVIDYCGYYYVLNPTSITRHGDQLRKFEAAIENHETFAAKIDLTALSKENYDYLEYLFFQSLTLAMLVNSRHAGKIAAKEMLKKRRRCLSSVFPKYLNNRYIGFTKLPIEATRTRFVLGCYALAERLGLDRFFVYMLAQ